MNLILAYQNLLDDWKDEKSYTKKAFVKILDKDYTRIVSKYPRQVRALEEFMRKTAEAEKNKETNLDLVAGLTGEMLGEIMCWREDEWQEEMRTLGFYMGKFIYLMDAYEDYEADQKKNCYNPLVYMEKENDQEFDTFCKLLLTSMMSECAKSFERLPILLHADILRNILYSGVWSRYEYLQLRKKKLEEKKPVIFCGDLNVAHKEIDLKKAAKVVGEKNLELLPVKDINKVTGYIRGGCTPIGMKKAYPTVIHESAETLPQMIVSGGRLGEQIMLKPDDLVRAVNGRYADIISAK